MTREKGNTEERGREKGEEDKEKDTEGKNDEWKAETEENGERCKKEGETKERTKGRKVKMRRILRKGKREKEEMGEKRINGKAEELRDRRRRIGRIREDEKDT